jgi:hypothetical protein
VEVSGHSHAPAALPRGKGPLVFIDYEALRPPQPVGNIERTAGIRIPDRTVNSLVTIPTELSQLVNSESEDGRILKIKWFYSVEKQQQHPIISTLLRIHGSPFSRPSSDQYFPAEVTIGGIPYCIQGARKNNYKSNYKGI